jgi:hypothetical protein
MLATEFRNFLLTNKRHMKVTLRTNKTRKETDKHKKNKISLFSMKIYKRFQDNYTLITDNLLTSSHEFKLNQNLVVQ